MAYGKAKSNCASIQESIFPEYRLEGMASGRKKSVKLVEVKMVKEKSVKFDVGAVRSAEDAARAIGGFLEGADREHFVILILDTKNRINGIHVVSIGTLNLSVVHPREVFKAAFLGNAASIILGHNHPSGDVTPSSEDIEITERLAQAGKILGIDVLDHVIVGDDNWLSFRAKGLM